MTELFFCKKKVYVSIPCLIKGHVNLNLITLLCKKIKAI